MSKMTETAGGKIRLSDCLFNAVSSPVYLIFSLLSVIIFYIMFWKELLL